MIEFLLDIGEKQKSSHAFIFLVGIVGDAHVNDFTLAYVMYEKVAMCKGLLVILHRYAFGYDFLRHPKRSHAKR